MNEIERNRYFLKDSIRKRIDFSKTPQSMGVAAPPFEKPWPDDAEMVDLPVLDWAEMVDANIVSCIRNRESRRSYAERPLKLEELSFLLWATQGIRMVAGHSAFRTVPSAGCRHTFETYLAVFNVEGLEEGLYRYIPSVHRLLVEYLDDNLSQRIVEASFHQRFTGESAVTFIWTTIPYRMEWRYGLAAHRVILIDAGHVCQNLYLACEAIGAGTCAVAAYDQEYLDEVLGVDGVDEFTIYMAPVGKV
ncbi:MULTISPECIES: SagB/ThcOx family dehydrogenase [unclassified Methanothermobacter]|uniref:SagB/ThcOx family dehydrogenase n=1 Tax=unclassified Methanothermobacter TaxID=2631116 RepID=UPI0002CD1070|nr:MULTISPECIES: SagB/ThcOx family dehydrogenase [unclassified Methanothermobacter]QEF93988.1 SagB/ThcOx family dehydrogenase [Methanothermobacter sp. KEPCO-1]QHN08583.1 SagB/ThcOx family dehydrogenase [Methanothermobacter sp. THM-2]BAM69330.1 putative nitroreductase [Methanothermobacter sp. CaT2]